MDEEQACNRFAGAFLFPRAAVFQALGKERRAVEWQELLLLKQQFQLSVGAICHRHKDLENYSRVLLRNLIRSPVPTERLVS